MCSEIIHVLLVTFSTQGHVNPFLRLAKRLASTGLHVTFSAPSDVGYKIRTTAKTSGAVSGRFTPVGKGYLRFEFLSDGWDNNDPRKFDLELYMAHLKNAGPAALEELIGRQAAEGRPRVNCVVGNPFVPWVLDVAGDMGIPCGVLWVQSCAAFSAYYHYHHKLLEFPSAEKPDLSVSLPGVPKLSTGEIPTFLLHTNPHPFVTAAVLAQFQNLSKATWVFVNSFEQLEGDVIRAVSPIAQLIPVGPLVDLPEETEFVGRAPEINGDLYDATGGCMEWLDSKEPRSVVYVSVGSVVQMSKEETAEMGWGLRKANRSFLWVVRDEERRLLPEGFDDLDGEGMVVGWSPQDRVLAHPSLACFVTHCGWSSSLECLAAGVPVVAFPHFSDQPMNAKYLVDVHGVGVHLPRDAGNGSSGGGISFTREDVARAVQEVTEGPRAEEMRSKAATFKEVVGAAMRGGGSTDRNAKAFHDELRRWMTAGGGSTSSS